ncbi:NUT family member 2-like [Grammomys surdaster]|uniref:NUT family member 2-like n=1 Tax=Grammomys surdaster TaxID=491861 RepID=UPI00109EF7D5|nr:NUT family member 2-like [Grammomys surdaster]
MDLSRQAWLLSKPIGIASEASSLGQNMTVNAGASMPTFATLPVLPPAPQPAPQLFWEPPAPLVTAGISPRNPLVLSALPGMSLVADGSTALNTAVPLNIVQLGTLGRPVQPVYNANLVLTQVPLNCNAPGTQGGGVGCSASLFMTTPATNTFINARIASAVQPQEGTWVLGPRPPTTQQVVQLLPVRSPVNSAPPPKGAYGERGPANIQANSPENYLSKPDSVYGNFRRWQHIKTLVQRHLPQTPDVAAFSCFLIPVLRSLARRKPTMTVEEGLWRGLQEWQCTSNYDRMIFFEMAEKFTEFESEEEMENSRLEVMRGIQCQVLATTPRRAPPRLPAPEVAEEPECTSMKTVPKTDPAHLPELRHQQLRKTETPMEIPPEAVWEYMDIMDWLEGFPQSFTGEPKEKEEDENSAPEQEGDDLYSDAGLLSYIDELCSQTHFVEQVEAIINPQFVAEILSTKPEMDILALTKELEHEEEFTVNQLLETHCLALKKKEVERAPPNPGAPQIPASASVLTVCQGAGRDEHGAQRGASAQTGFSQMASLDHHYLGATSAEIWGPTPATVFPSNQSSPSLADIRSTRIPCGRGIYNQSPRSRYAGSLGIASAIENLHGPLSRTVDDIEEIYSLSFLLASQYKLVPWRLSEQMCPFADLFDSADIPKPCPKIRGLSPDPYPIAKSKKQALFEDLVPMAKRPILVPGHGVSEGPLSALELAYLSQSQKRKYEPLGTRKRKRKKRH